MKEKKQSELSVLLGYAGKYRALTFLGMFLSAVAMVMGMLPYVCIWLAARDLIAVAPNWTEATQIAIYGWMAFGFGGILVYFTALMCTHLAAFRTAANIRKQGVARMMKAPLGFFDNYGSGFLRNRLDGGAAETETLLAHNLADVVGTAAMFIVMIVLMFVFDWRMGAACLLAGKTVLVIAHRMRTVEAADKIVMLKDGKVVEQGSPAALLQNPQGVFAHMRALQSASAGWHI